MYIIQYNLTITFPISRGRGSGTFFKDADESFRVAVPQMVTDVVNFHWRGEQQIFGLLNTDVREKLRKRKAGGRFYDFRAILC